MTRFYYDAQGREHESGDWDADVPRPMTADEELRRAAEAFIAHLDSAPKLGWTDNDPAMLPWAATEYRLQEGIRAALAATPPAERLDVERLAQVCRLFGLAEPQGWAVAIASKYAALAPEQPEGAGPRSMYDPTLVVDPEQPE